MLVPLENATAELCGGKAAGLRRLLERGIPVPPGLCLPVSVYKAALPTELPPVAVADTPLAIGECCRQVTDALMAWQPD